MKEPSNGSIPWSDYTFKHVSEAHHRGGHRVWLRFDDGLEGEIDLGPEIYGQVFEPLKDPEYFASFVVDQTLTWENGADFAPEFLYERLIAAKRDAAPTDR